MADTIDQHLEKYRVHSPTICGICLEAYDKDATVCKLPQCTHQFHMDCIKPWLIRDNSRPTCRHVVYFDPNGVRVMNVLDDENEKYWKVSKIAPCPIEELRTRKCAVCMVDLSQPCFECAVLDNVTECFLTWGQCGHTYHLHCRMRLRSSPKLARICPLDQLDWKSEAITVVGALSDSVNSTSVAQSSIALH